MSGELENFFDIFLSHEPRVSLDVVLLITPWYLADGSASMTMGKYFSFYSPSVPKSVAEVLPDDQFERDTTLLITRQLASVLRARQLNRDWRDIQPWHEMVMADGPPEDLKRDVETLKELWGKARSEFSEHLSRKFKRKRNEPLLAPEAFAIYANELLRLRPDEFWPDVRLSWSEFQFHFAETALSELPELARAYVAVSSRQEFPKVDFKGPTKTAHGQFAHAPSFFRKAKKSPFEKIKFTAFSQIQRFAKENFDSNTSISLDQQKSDPRIVKCWKDLEDNLRAKNHKGPAEEPPPYLFKDFETGELLYWSTNLKVSLRSGKNLRAKN